MSGPKLGARESSVPSVLSESIHCTCTTKANSLDQTYSALPFCSQGKVMLTMDRIQQWDSCCDNQGSCKCDQGSVTKWFCDLG